MRSSGTAIDARSASESPVRNLPVHDMSQIHLSDHLTGPGCPLCAIRAAAQKRYLETLIYEGVNDPGNRDELIAGRGYCGRHALALRDEDREQTGESLGTAILYAAVLRERLGELKRLVGVRGRGLTRHVDRASVPPRCPVCGHVAAANRRAILGLIRLLGDDAWVEAMARAAFCLEDLLGLWSTVARSGSPAQARFEPIGEAQVARLAQLTEDLEDLSHNSTWDRRQLLTDAQMQSTRRGADCLAGTESQWRRRIGGDS